VASASSLVSELESCLYISREARRRQRKTECWRLCDGCLQVDNNQEDSQEDCRKRLKHSRVQSDSSRFARRADRQQDGY
jgi:hypothetical protein